MWVWEEPSTIVFFALPPMDNIKRVLVVCLGNICRSPMGEGVLRNAAKGLNMDFDSAGTQGYHTGDAPDPRAVQCMKDHGIDIAHLAARKFSARDFESFDLILTMDGQNFRDVLIMAPNEASRKKVKPFLEPLSMSGANEVPDPYYGNQRDFDRVFELCSQAAALWCEQWKGQ